MTIHTPEWQTRANSLRGFQHYYNYISLRLMLKIHNCFLTNALMKGRCDRPKPVWSLYTHWGLWQFSCAVGHRVTGSGPAAAVIDRLTVSMLGRYLPSVGSLWESHQLELRVIGGATPRQTWKVFFCRRFLRHGDDISSKKNVAAQLTETKLAYVNSCPSNKSKTQVC